MTPDAEGWLRISYGFAEHPKILRLAAEAGADAVLIHLRVMGWVGRTGTDGHVPAAAASLHATPKVRAALVAAGVWDALPDGSYVIHDWAEYQPPSDPEARARWLNADRQRRFRGNRRDRDD